MMKKFLLDFVGFLVICTVLLMAISYATDQGFKNGNNPDYAVWNGMDRGTINADVLIQGNSHARVQIDPLVIDSAIGSNSFNIAADGIGFDVQYARYLLYKKHNRKPKMIIQCSDYVFLGPSDHLYDEEQYLPYLNDENLMDAVTKIDVPLYCKYAPFLKWQNQPKAILSGLRSFLKKPKPNRTERDKGFAPKDFDWQTTNVADFRKMYPHYVPDFDRQLYLQFETFLQSCKQDSIKVLMVMPPTYTSFQKTILLRNGYLGLLKQTATKYQAIFLDFSEDTICNNKAFFYNYTHLNRTGAVVFSQKLAARLKTLKQEGKLY